MPKGYICTWERSQERPYETDFWFDSDSKNAAKWLTQQEAETDCAMLSKKGIKIPSSDGGTFFCTQFHVEERAPHEFIIFCEAPFIQRTSATK
jgi:hypothetical protein